MTFFKVKKIDINEEWQKLYNKVKNNKVLSVLSTFILLFIDLALPIIISILVVNSDFGQRLETYQKILLVCVFFIGLALFVFVVLIIIYFIKFLFFKLKNSFGKITNYELLYSKYSKEVNIKNTMNIPHIEIPNYRYFKLIFQNNEKVLKGISFKIGITSAENWNIKVGLTDNNIEIFYIILHTRIPNDNRFPASPGDGGDSLNIAVQNRDLKEDNQYLECLREFKASKLSNFKLQISDNKDLFKKINYFINGTEIKIDNRIEIIRNEALHNVNLEVWSSYFYKRDIKVNAIFKDLKIVWE